VVVAKVVAAKVVAVVVAVVGKPMHMTVQKRPGAQNIRSGKRIILQEKEALLQGGDEIIPHHEMGDEIIPHSEEDQAAAMIREPTVVVMVVVMVVVEEAPATKAKVGEMGEMEVGAGAHL